MCLREDRCRQRQARQETNGFFSNNEPILNALGKCDWGSHEAEALVPNKQPLIPEEFAKAICNGILHSMMTDYAARVPEELSYPALGESGDDMEVQEVEEVLDEAAQD